MHGICMMMNDEKITCPFLAVYRNGIVGASMLGGGNYLNGLNANYGGGGGSDGKGDDDHHFSELKSFPLFKLLN